MKKILITGALGYLGSVLTPYLIERGYDCLGYDTGFFKDCSLFAPKKYQVIIKDVRELNENELYGVDVVVHLAGMMNETVGHLTSENIYNPIRAYTLRLAEMCKALGIRFIFSSSCSAYGFGDEIFNEQSAVHPQTPYALNKYEIEQDLQSISDENFSPIALRLSTLFGLSPFVRFDMLVNMLAGMAVTTNEIILNSDGLSWRPHVYITDVCEAFRCAIDFDYRAGRLLVVNVGRDENNTQTLEVARLVQSIRPGCELQFLSQLTDMAAEKKELIQGSTGTNITQTGKDTRSFKVSFAKIKEVFPQLNIGVTLTEGIKQMFVTLDEIKLTEEKFQSSNFYRLKHMNKLYAAGKLNDNLYWKNNT